MVVNRWFLALPALLALVALAGCGEQEQVVSYTVPKPHVLEKQNPPPPATSTDADDVQQLRTSDEPAPSGAPRDRMLAAIVPQGERFWFFKVTGPKDAIQEQIEEFLALVESVRFADEKSDPTWTLPEGWRQQPGSGMRFASLEIASPEGPFDLSVIPLPVLGDREQSVLDNVNRWLGQMGVAPITQEQLTKGTELETGGDVRQTEVDGRTVTLANVVGALRDSRMSGAPFASSPSTSPRAPVAGAPAELTFETPQGWTPGRAGGFRKAAFEIADGAQKAEMTVIDLAGSAGDLLPNVNRWRGQIGLEPASEQELDAELRTIPVGGIEGRYVHLVGPEQATLGVIVRRDEKSWFFKLTGDASLVAREQERFEQFVRSVQFK